MAIMLNNLAEMEELIQVSRQILSFFNILIGFDRNFNILIGFDRKSYIKSSLTC